nr:phosphatidylinositol-glycan biosynthesis class F protein [Ipomoea batatas]
MTVSPPSDSALVRRFVTNQDGFFPNVMSFEVLFYCEDRPRFLPTLSDYASRSFSQPLPATQQAATRPATQQAATPPTAQQAATPPTAQQATTPLATQPFDVQDFRYLGMTLYWSLVMSVFTFVPAATVFGSSWTDWHRIFAQTKPAKNIDYMVFFPAHGAIIGAWFGAWPMPLDWERPWQEWPICVTYGAMAGYLVGMAVSLGFILFHNRPQHIKGE